MGMARLWVWMEEEGEAGPMERRARAGIPFPKTPSVLELPLRLLVMRPEKLKRANGASARMTAWCIASSRPAALHFSFV